MAAGALGAAAALMAAPQPWAWASVGAGAGTAQVLVTASGTQLAPAVSGLGLVGLAGAAAVVAVSAWARLATGVVLAGAGAGIAWSCLALLSDPAAALGSHSARLPAGVTLGPGAAATSAWPWLALTGGVLLALTGLFVTVRGRRWPGMSQRYQAPGAALPGHQRDPRAVWEALDRGEDPTG